MHVPLNVPMQLYSAVVLHPATANSFKADPGSGISGAGGVAGSSVLYDLFCFAGDKKKCYQEGVYEYVTCGCACIVRIYHQWAGSSGEADPALASQVQVVWWAP